MNTLEILDKTIADAETNLEMLRNVLAHQKQTGLHSVKTEALLKEMEEAQRSRKRSRAKLRAQAGS